MLKIKYFDKQLLFFSLFCSSLQLSDKLLPSVGDTSVGTGCFFIGTGNFISARVQKTGY